MEKIGKVTNWVKLAIPSHSEPLWWEKIGKVVNRVKLAILSHSEPLWSEMIGKVAYQANWPFQVILSNFGGKRLEKFATWTKSNFSGGQGWGVHQPVQ